jgi:hypothetical protein
LKSTPFVGTFQLDSAFEVNHSAFRVCSCDLTAVGWQAYQAVFSERLMVVMEAAMMGVVMVVEMAVAVAVVVANAAAASLE